MQRCYRKYKVHAVRMRFTSVLQQSSIVQLNEKNVRIIGIELNLTYHCENQNTSFSRKETMLLSV